MRAEMAWRGGLQLLATLLMVVLTARLGLWQLDRAAQKNALEQQRQERAQLSPLGASDLVVPGIAGAHLWQRRVSVEGRWAAAHTVYLDNRPMQGRVGFYVLTPLLLEGGRAVLVQRGWLPRDAAERTRIAPYRTASACVRVRGRIAPEPARLVELGAAASGPIRQNLDLAAYARQTPLGLLPFVIVQDEAPGADAAEDDGLLRAWPLVAADVHKNYGYALQWFALCALLIGLYVWFRILQPRRRSRR